jgi:hypothetical protein
VLRIEAAGFLAREVAVSGAAEPVRVALRRRPSWKAEILDASGRSPIPGAACRLLDERGSEAARRAAGADGVCLFRDLEVRPYTLSAEAPGLYPAKLGPKIPGPSDPAEILLLRRAIHVSGRVREGAQPAGGARLFGWRKGDPASRVETRTGGDGSFRLGPLPEGEPAVLFAATASGSFGHTMTRGGREAETLDVVAGAIVKACGRRAEDGKPAIGFELRVATRDAALREASEAGAFALSEKAASDGSCASLRLPAGTYRPAVGASGLLGRELPELELAPGEEKDLGTIGLEPEAALALRVLGREGRPFEGATVEVYGRGGGRKRLGVERTDATGRVRLSGLEPGLYDVEVTAQGETPVWEERIPVPGPEREIRLRSGGTVRGDVVESGGGAPIPRFELTVLPLRIGLGRMDYRLVKLVESSGQTLYEDEGRFAIHGIPEGRYVLRVTARGFSPAVVPFEIGGDRAAAEVHVEMNRGACATGIVVARRDGLPVAGAVLRESEQSAAFSKEAILATADAQGRFEVCDLAEGESRQAVVDHPGFAPAPVVLTSSKSETVILEEGGTLAGRLVGEEGRGIEGWSAELSGRGWKKTAVTDESGGFEFEGLPAGSALLVLTDPLGDGYDSREEREIVLEAGGTKEVEISVGTALRGRLLLDGAPLEGVTLRAIRMPDGGGTPSEWSVRQTRSGEGGRFVLTRLAPGTHLVQALLEDELVNRVVQVGPSGAEIELRVGGIEVSGVTMDGDNGTVLGGVEARTASSRPAEGMSQFTFMRPSRGGFVEIRGFSADVNVTTSRADGSFRLHVAEDTPAVILSHPEFLPAEAPIERFLPSQIPALPLYRGGFLSVTLVDGARGTPCPGWVSLLASTSHSDDRYVLTQTGSVRFDAVRQGRYQLWGACPGTAPTRLAEPIEMRAGDELEKTLVLGAGARVEVFLEDDGSEPIGQLWLRDEERDLTYPILSALLDEALVENRDGLLHIVFERFPAGSFVLADRKGASHLIEATEGDRIEVRFDRAAREQAPGP